MSEICLYCGQTENEYGHGCTSFTARPDEPKGDKDATADVCLVCRHNKVAHCASGCSMDFCECENFQSSRGVCVVVYKDGTWVRVRGAHVWEYMKDPGYLVTIPAQDSSSTQISELGQSADHPESSE